MAVVVAAVAAAAVAAAVAVAATVAIAAAIAGDRLTRRGARCARRRLTASASSQTRPRDLAVTGPRHVLRSSPPRAPACACHRRATMSRVVTPRATAFRSRSPTRAATIPMRALPSLLVSLLAFPLLAQGTAQPFGTGCPSPGPTALGYAPNPGGGQLELFETGLAPGAVPVAVLGFSATQWNGVPLPLSLAGLGLPGCSALLEPVLQTVTAVPALGV